MGLYLSPPDNALVLCVDEKSQCQALERTQPMLPMGLGYVEGVTHDYVRHGTTTLFAALNVLNGAVLATCKPRHRHQEFLSFLREIDKAVPADLDIHCILDNYARHKHPKVKAWLASPAALAHALHPDLQLLAQSGRALLRADHRQGHPPRLLHQRQAAGAAHRPVRRPLQPSRSPSLDRHR